MFVSFKNVFRKTIFARSYCQRAAKNDRKTMGIIVIGDEILKGEVQDTNSAFLAQELHKLGLKLQKISVIGDEINDVSQEVRLFSGKYDYVITSGGIGCTHDDITFEAVAKAFNVPLYEHPELRKLCFKFYKTENPDSPGLKLARVPSIAKLNWETSAGYQINYPIISVNNIYIFPGIPQLLRKAFLASSKVLFRTDSQFFTKNIFCNATEDKIVDILNTVVQEYPQVQFGSYPKLNDSEYKVKLTIESSKEDLTEKAYQKLLDLLPKGFIVK
ncbi:unnamed protein product [Brassicogethes aeneus]|uniref:MoaB/Mog domain-containing protein n=1 Tax=Brassicogethes aeneus TaxID=1431903 RepID=A0A9P0FHD9_BRAAE|nr:unnamed protein product [Brassicogethes aeneus]